MVRITLQKLAVGLFILLYSISTNGQQLTFAEEGVFEWSAVLPYSSYSSLFDGNDLPYLYTANAQLGMVTFDISDPNNPIPIDTIPTSALGGLHVTNLAVHGNLLLISAGGFAGFTQQTSSLAIVDVSDPTNPIITDQWIAEGTTAGAAVVVTDGNMACLGVMEDGIHLLDISDEYNISFLGTALPDPNFPEPPQGVFQPQARGLALRNDTLFVCNDSKGFRMFDLGEPTNPVEIGKHMNADIFTNALPAYNEVVVLDHYAYATVDYCGIEVIDISDTAMQTINHVDTWNCMENDWGCNEGHSNQIRLVGDSLLFVSGADTELIVFDISNRENPEFIGQYGEFGDLSVAWGVGVRNHEIALAQIDFNVPCGLTVPYQSDWGGIRLLVWDTQVATQLGEQSAPKIVFFPNPASQFIQIQWPSPFVSGRLTITDIRGVVVLNEYCDGSTKIIDTSRIPDGIYMLHVKNENGKTILNEKLIVSCP